MEDTKKKREAVNLSLRAAERDDLQDLAVANRMTVTQLVRFLGAKAIDAPEGFGLLPPKHRSSRRPTKRVATDGA